MCVCVCACACVCVSRGVNDCEIPSAGFSERLRLITLARGGRAIRIMSRFMTGLSLLTLHQFTLCPFFLPPPPPPRGHRSPTCRVHLFITWLLNVTGGGGQLLSPVDCEQRDYTTSLHNSGMDRSQRTSSRFVALITLGHIVSREAFKMYVF